jgi:hypothetical protein
MAKFVHVARILPGQTEAFLANVKNGFEMGAPALKALGLTRITSFHTPEADSGEGGLLVNDIRGRGRVCDQGTTQ